MSERPVLNKELDGNTFRSFYYLKEELVSFVEKIGKSLEEAITCWKYKKSLQGHNRYERSDLVALGQ